MTHDSCPCCFYLGEPLPLGFDGFEDWQDPEDMACLRCDATEADQLRALLRKTERRLAVITKGFVAAKRFFPNSKSLFSKEYEDIRAARDLCGA